jgi:hypothetical protein
MLAEMNANMKSNQEMMKSNKAKAAKEDQIPPEIIARMNTNLNEMREEIKSGQAEMRSTICAFRSELKETIHHEMKAVIQPIRPELDEPTACNGATETEPDPGLMQSVEENQEIPKEHAAVMPVGGPRKRPKICNLAAERCQKRKERTL